MSLARQIQCVPKKITPPPPFSSAVTEVQKSAELMGLLFELSYVCLSVVCQLLLKLFSVILNLIVMKLGTNDTGASSYKVTEWILQICIN